MHPWVKGNQVGSNVALFQGEIIVKIHFFFSLELLDQFQPNLAQAQSIVIDLEEDSG